jgi:hypothetical protein
MASLAVVALGTAEEMLTTLLMEGTVETEAFVWATFDKDAEDRMATSVGVLCVPGLLKEHDPDPATALEVEGTTRLIEDGDVTEIAAVRESYTDKANCSKELLTLPRLKLAEEPTTERLG